LQNIWFEKYSYKRQTIYLLLLTDKCLVRLSLGFDSCPFSFSCKRRRFHETTKWKEFERNLPHGICIF